MTRIEQMTPNVRRFFLSTPAGSLDSFVAGQFVTFDLPIGEKRLQRWRSYSIANLPKEGAELELCIVRSASGLGTQYFFERVTEGTILRWKGPEGNFVLPQSLEKDLVFICTGTGIAPFRSMLHAVQQQDLSGRSIHLIFGARYEADILYRTEMEQLAQALPNFRYEVALSRQPNWHGHQGYVHPIYMQQYATVRPDVAFYVCGWSKMIDETIANLLVKLGYDRTQVFYELYG